MLLTFKLNSKPRTAQADWPKDFYQVNKQNNP